MPQQANNSDLYEDAPVCGLQFGHFTKLVGTGYFFSLFTGGNWFQLPLGKYLVRSKKPPSVFLWRFFAHYVGRIVSFG